MSSVCRACFAGSAGDDVKLHIIEDRFFGIYEKLTNIKLSSEDGRHNKLCYICNAQLKKCCRFSEMARRSEEYLRDALRSDTKMNNKMTYVPIPSLSVRTLKPLTLDGLSKSRMTRTKKYESILILHDDEEPLNKKTEVNKETIGTQDLIAKLEAEEIANEELYDINLGLLNEEVDLDDFTDVKDFIIDNKDLSYKCDECTNIYPTRKELATHHSETHEIKENPCPICNKSVVGDRCRLLDHIRAHEQRTFICDYCGKISRKKHHLREHIRLHTGERVHCKTCNRSFAHLSSMRKHALIHIRKEPNSCQFCNKTVNHSEHMRSHVRFVHQGSSGLYFCEICGAKFEGMSQLQQHMRSHRGRKAYSCDYCGNKFAKSSGKKRHMEYLCKLKSTGEFVYRAIASQPKGE